MDNSLIERFAPGMAGKKAKAIINGGAKCVNCSEPATMTLDFDIFAHLEQLPVCTKCLPKVRNRVIADLKATGREPSFGTNGWGRS